MGFKTTLTVKHATDGYSFKIDVNPDADALGIKVLIWELQKVPVESQRLVFNGKEMTDSMKVTEFGITDGDTLFLIEAKKQQIEAVTAVEPIPIVPTYIEPQFKVTETGIKATTDIEKGTVIGSYEPIHIPVPAPTAVNHNYAFLDVEERNEAKINSVVKLSAWIRAYLWMGFILTFLATLFCCVYSVVPFFCYALGLIGARKLCKCLLVFPIILTALIGFGGLTVNVIWFYDIRQFIPITIAILHIIIFSCITKLVIKIARLNKSEKLQARARIMSRRCCC